MKLKVIQFYQGWASDEEGWGAGIVVNVSDAVIDLPGPDAPDSQRRGSRASYLLETYPERFVEVKARGRNRAEPAEE